MRASFLQTASVLGLLLLCGCAQMMGQLRRDLDDGGGYDYSAPTVGGRWSERNLLGNSDEHYASVGHSERSPASVSLREPSRRGWLDEPSEGPVRDAGYGSEEEVASFSNTPSLPPSTRRLYKNGARATRSDFVDDAANEGSLWASDGQTNYYFTKNKIRGVGDILSVVIEPEMLRDVHVEVARNLNSRERDLELFAAQERIRARALGLPDPDAPAQSKDQVTASNAAPARQPAGNEAPAVKPEDVAVRSATLADIDLSRSLKLGVGEPVMAEIVERYPNGNYKVRGNKRVPYRNGYRMLTMIAVVKGADINEDDTVPSGKLYEYRLEVVR